MMYFILIADALGSDASTATQKCCLQIQSAIPREAQKWSELLPQVCFGRVSFCESLLISTTVVCSQTLNLLDRLF